MKITMDSIKRHLSFNAPQFDIFYDQPYSQEDFDRLKIICNDLQTFENWEEYVKSFDKES